MPLQRVHSFTERHKCMYIHIGHTAYKRYSLANLCLSVNLFYKAIKPNNKDNFNKINVKSFRNKDCKQ
jgi:hypothetical protein